MICDLHVHLAGVGAGGSGNWLAPAFQRSYAFRRVVHGLKLPSGMLARPDCDTRIAGQITAWIADSVLDHAVLLAFDAAYHDDGTRDHAHTLLVTDNDFVADLAAAHGKILFGASLHPYRRDAVAELERLIGRGACLVKWLPGAQNIQPDHPRCLPFYDALAHHRIPLLCHTGVEHTLKAFPNTLNDPRRLIPALERGVAVIAAHCGTRIFLHEKSYFRSWQAMALRYDQFYGDISAFGMVTRIWSLRHLLKSPALTAKLLFGSDFPVAPAPLSCLGPLSLRQALELRRMTNPFDQAVAMMQAVGVPDAVFARAAQLLRMPPDKQLATSANPGANAA
ncbi:MAG: amidohydrolase family protein [Verrucomicrobia bacterium]|nr:amidohydrolase family protein [Verrucomicrobiota bacterium]